MDNKVDFDKYTDNYNQLLREGTAFFASNEEYFAEYKVKIVTRLVGASVSRVLEFGCGIGRNIPYLKAAFPKADVFGTDISKASLEVAARDNPGVRFFDLETAKGNEGGFDLIFVAGVFHHVQPAERTAVMSSVYEYLNPKGELFVFEHNPYNPVTRRIVNNCVYDEDAVLLKPCELKNLVAGAGLDVKGGGYCLFVPPKLSGLAVLENYLEWLPLGGQYWVKAVKS